MPSPVTRPTEFEIDGNLYLVGPQAQMGIGVLEVFYDYQWGLVCDDGFTQESADVACKQLGFAEGAKKFADSSCTDVYYGDPEEFADSDFSSPYAGRRSSCIVPRGSGIPGAEQPPTPDEAWSQIEREIQWMPILMDDVTCKGEEQSLASCQFGDSCDPAAENCRQWEQHNCDWSEAVVLDCINPDAPKPPPLPVRLNDGKKDGEPGKNPGEGRLEVFYDGEWGTVRRPRRSPPEPAPATTSAPAPSPVAGVRYLRTVCPSGIG